MKPELIEIERRVYVPVPAHLTNATPGPDIPWRPLFADDLERIALGYEGALDQCNADKAAIRDLAGAEPADPAN